MIVATHDGKHIAVPEMCIRDRWMREFYPLKNGGRSSWCHECVLEYKRERYRKLSLIHLSAELIGACKASLERLYTCRNNLDFAIENAHGDDETLVEKAAEMCIRDRP